MENLKLKFKRIISNGVQDAIKYSEDPDEAVESVFYLVAAGKGNKAKKPNLIQVVEFMMTHFDWLFLPMSVFVCLVEKLNILSGIF